MIEKNEDREERIIMEIIVDTYDKYERAMGWYCYVENLLEFPFQAHCIAKKSMSPLKVNESVTVVGLADSEDCESKLFVMIKYEEDELAVPLEQLEILDDKPKSKQIIEDWHYWIGRGYEY